MPSDDVSVYAGWTPADRTVQFDVRADDAEITGVPADQSVRAGECAETPEIPENLETPEKSETMDVAEIKFVTIS